MQYNVKKEEQPILPMKPPAELIPKGYNRKVIVMWLSFFGVIFGAANLGNPLAIVLPVSAGILFIDLAVLIFSRLTDRALWLYKEAQESYYRKRYDKTLRKLEKLLELRPDIEEKLLPALVVCKSRTGDFAGAMEYCQKLFEQDKVGAGSNNALLVEILKVLKNCGRWERMIEIAEYLPEEELYNDFKNYFKGVAYFKMGQPLQAKGYFDRIEDHSAFIDLEIYKTQDRDYIHN